MAFADAGISPNADYQQYFNGNAPDTVRISEHNFCLPIFGLHHVPHGWMQSMETAMNRRERTQDYQNSHITTYGDVLVMLAAIAKGHSARDVEGRYNWDYLHGIPDSERHPIAWGKRRTALICKATCEAHPDLCLAWVYKVETRDCWMSRHVVPGKHTPKSLSGLSGVRMKQLRSNCAKDDWRTYVRNLQSSRLALSQ